MARNETARLIRAAVIIRDLEEQRDRVAAMESDESFHVVIRAREVGEIGPGRIPADIYVVVPDDQAVHDGVGVLDSRLAPEAGIVVLSSTLHPATLERRLERNWGWAARDVEADRMLDICYAVAHGYRIMDGESRRPADDRVDGPLSERESEVLELLARGMANADIAKALGVSVNTIKFHLASLYEKLDVSNRTEAVRAGIAAGIVAL